MRIPMPDHLRRSDIRNVENHRAAVDIPDIRAVRPVRIHVGVVRTPAGVELRMPRDRRRVVALARAGIPPAAQLAWLGRVADVDRAIELVVAQVAGREVRRAGGAMNRLAIDEPKLVHAARRRTGAIEERDAARFLGLADVPHLDAGRRRAVRAGLVRDGHDVAADLQRVGAHVPMRQLGLRHHARLARIGHVHGGEILRRAFMRHPQHAAAVVDLQADALADIAEAGQRCRARSGGNY